MRYVYGIPIVFGPVSQLVSLRKYRLGPCGRGQQRVKKFVQDISVTLFASRPVSMHFNGRHEKSVPRRIGIAETPAQRVVFPARVA